MVGAGYIAVEIAGVLHSLGSDVTLYIRRDEVRDVCRKDIEGKCDFLPLTVVLEPVALLFVCFSLSGSLILCFVVSSM